MEPFRCLFPLCVFLALRFTDFMNHINTVHSSYSDFAVTCNIEGCTKTFSKYNSLNRHVHRKHEQFFGYDNGFKEQVEIFLPVAPVEEPGQDPSDSYTGNTSRIDNNEFSGEDNSTQHKIDSIDLGRKGDEAPMDLEYAAARFLLRLKEKHKITQSALREVCDGTSFLQFLCIETLKNNVLHTLDGAEVSQNMLEMVEECFDDIPDPLENLRSEWLQDRYFKHHFNYLEPRQVELGKRLQFTGIGNKRRIAEITDKFYYVPVIENLENLLSSEMLEAIMRHTSYREDGKFGGFIDGFIARNHPVFSVNIRALQIAAYHDEIQVCNAIGTHVKNNKLVMFYYIILNLPRTCRSKLQAVNLLAVAKTLDVQRYGFDAILRPFKEDMEKLADGYTLQLISGKQLTIQAALACYLADTPASQMAGGFKEGVGGAFKKCRHCDAIFETMQTNFAEENFTARTLERHLEHCETVEAGIADLQNHYSVTYGVTRRSILCEFPYFNVCEQLPQDIMHVLLEGVIPYTVKVILHYFIYTRKLFGLKDLNNGIANFEYSYFNAGDKPNFITSSGLHGDSKDLKQESLQMWLLYRILPFIIGDKIDLESMHWKLNILLMKIVSISFSPVISLETIAKLKKTVSEYLSLFKKLFPRQNIVPKQHYMVHFPRLIMMLGPLIWLWCMRLEAKHSYFKSLHTTLNFKNVPYSLAKRHQKLAAAEKEASTLFIKVSNTGPAKKQSDDAVKSAISRIKTFYPIDESQVYCFKKIPWVTVHGTKYVAGECAVATSVGSNELPIFGSLINIFQINERFVFFECAELDTIGFDEQLNAFEVDEQMLASGLLITTPDDLLTHEPLKVQSFQGHKFVTLKFEISDLCH